jgi:YHS domain-containing protein
LQETHSTVDKIDTWKYEWKGKAYFGGNKSNKTGVAIPF